MKSENLSRRMILKSGLVACVGACSLEAIAKGAEEVKKAIEAKKQIPVGLQLWTVREECKKDFFRSPQAIKFTISFRQSITIIRDMPKSSQVV